MLLLELQRKGAKFDDNKIMILATLSIISSILIFISGAGLIPRRIPMPFFVRCFVGINICGLIAIPILYIEAKIINLIIPIFIATGYISLLVRHLHQMKDFRISKLVLNQAIKRVCSLAVISSIVSFTLKDFFPTNYIYSEHDLLYWSWATNFHDIDYSGTIQSEIAWPLALTSYHLLSGMVLGYLNYFSPFQNLSGIILIKFAFIILSISALLMSLANKNRSQLIKLVLSLGLPFLLFRHEFSYNLLISNYLATLITLIIFWVMFKGNLDDKNYLIALLFLIMGLSKFILLPICTVISLFFFLRASRQMPKLFGLLLGSIWVLNIYMWIAMESPRDSASIKFYNPFSSNYFVQSLKYVDWITDPLLTNTNLGGFRYIFGGFILAVVLGKIFLLFCYVYRKFSDCYISKELAYDDRYYYLTSWLVFMLYSLIGYLFIRVDFYGIKHSAQLLYLSSTVTLMFLFLFIVKLELSKLQTFSLIILLSISSIFSPYRLLDGFSIISPMRELGAGSLKNTIFGEEVFEQVNQVDTHPQEQLKSSIGGTKLNCSESSSDRIMSPLYLFLYQKKGNTC